MAKVNFPEKVVEEFSGVKERLGVGLTSEAVNCK